MSEKRWNCSWMLFSLLVLIRISSHQIHANEKTIECSDPYGRPQVSFNYYLNIYLFFKVYITMCTIVCIYAIYYVIVFFLIILSGKLKKKLIIIHSKYSISRC